MKRVKMSSGISVEVPDDADEEETRRLYERAQKLGFESRMRSKEFGGLSTRAAEAKRVVKEFGSGEVETTPEGEIGELRNVGQRIGAASLNIDSSRDQVNRLKGAIPGLKSEDVLFTKIPGSDEVITLVRDPDTGMVREADSPDLNRMDVADLAGEALHSPFEFALNTVMPMAVPGSGMLPALARIGATGAGSMAGNVVDRLIGGGQGLQSVDPLSAESFQRSAGAGLASAAGEGIGEALTYGSRLATGRTGMAADEMSALARESEALGLHDVGPWRGDASTRQRRRFSQAIGSTDRAPARQVDRLSRVLSHAEHNLPSVDVNDIQALSGALTQEMDRVKVAATARLGTVDPVRTKDVLESVDNFERWMDTGEAVSGKEIKDVVERDNLAFDLGSRKKRVERLAIGNSVLQAKANAEAVVKIDAPTDEFNNLLQSYMLSADKVQTVDLPIGRFNPVEAFLDMHRKARKLLGTRNRQFDDQVKEFISVVEDTLRNPIIVAGRTAPTSMATPSRFRPGGRQVPADFDDAVDFHLSLTKQIDDTRAAMALREDVRTAVTQGRVFDVGKELISPNDPTMVIQLEQIGRASNRPELLDEAAAGYRQLLVNEPDMIETQLRQWKQGAGPEKTAAFRKVISEQEEKQLVQYSQTISRLRSAPITQALESGPDGLTAPVVEAIAKSDRATLRQIITSGGGKDSPAARVVKAGIMKHILEASTTVAGDPMVGAVKTTIDPGKYLATFKQFERTKLLDELLSPEEVKFWGHLEKLLPLLPKELDMGSSLMAAQLAQAAGQVPIPPIGSPLKWAAARGHVLTAEMYAVLYTSKFFQAAFRSRITPGVEGATRIFLTHMNRAGAEVERDVSFLEKTGKLKVRETPVVKLGERGAMEVMEMIQQLDPRQFLNQPQP